MENKEQLSLLCEIGRLDLKIIAHREKLQGLGKESHESLTAAQELESLIQKLNDKKNDLLKHRRALDDRLQQERAHLRKWETRAEKIKGEREYTALMSEIGTQKRTIAGVSAELNEVQDELKKIDEELSKKNKAHEQKASAAKTLHDAVHDVLSEQEELLAKDNAARNILLERLPQVLRARYQRIYEKRANKGVAFLKDAICQACMRMVPPELFIKVSKGDLVEQCPSCQRLLVVEHEQKIEQI